MGNDVTEKKTSRKKTKQKGDYKVVFRGRLLPGFDKERVIANIVKLTKLPPEKIEKKFFTGKKVIIRRADNVDYAKKLQQLFTKAGLEVFVLKDTTLEKKQKMEEIKEISKKEIITKELKKTVKTRKRPLIAILLGVVFIAMMYVLWDQFHVESDVPEEVINIEHYLADKDLVLLTHLKNGQLSSMERSFSNVLTQPQMTLFRQLQHSGKKAKISIQQIISAVYVEDSELVSQFVFLGDFSVSAVTRFFIKHYQGKAVRGSRFSRMKISDINQTHCETGKSMEVSIEPGRLVLSSVGHLDEFHRLVKQMPDDDADLTNWQSYKKDKLMSMILFRHEALQSEQGKNLISAQAGTFAQKFIHDNKALDSLYVSVGSELMSSSAVVDVRLNSKNSVWLDKTLGKLQTQLAAMKQKTRGFLKLPAFLNGISFHRDDFSLADSTVGQIVVQLEIGSALKDSVDDSLREFAEYSFLKENIVNNISAQAETNAGIDIESMMFLPRYSSAQLKDFDETIDTLFKPAWIGGPFALAFDDLLLGSSQQGDHILIQLHAVGQNIENVADHQARISISSVQDKEGKNLLARQQCSASKISNSAFFSRLAKVKNTQNNLQVRQQIKLEKGVKFSQVESLHGSIELNIATKTVSKQFEKNNDNKVLTHYGSRLLFQPSSQNRLSYIISEDQKKVLKIRALNNKGQYLNGGVVSSEPVNNAFVSGRSIIQEYQGEIAKVEVVYAEKTETIEYPIFINKLPPYPTDEQWEYHLDRVNLSSLDIWNKKYRNIEELDFSQDDDDSVALEPQSSWHKGPINMAIYGLKTNKYWGTTAQLMIKTPVIEELLYNLSAVEVFFKSPKGSEGNETGKSYFYPIKADGTYINGRFVPAGNKSYLGGMYGFSLAYNKENVPLRQLKGEVRIHLPLSKHNTTFTDLNIGALWEDEGLQLKMVRLGTGVMEFEVLSKRSRLLQINLLDSSDNRISTTGIYYGTGTKSGLKEGNIRVDFRGVPAKALLSVSEGQQTKRYPFTFKLSDH